MAQTTASTPTTSGNGATTDQAESAVRALDASTREATGVSLLHILTIGSIGASIALFLAGKREQGIFIGLWAPTFQALKSAAERT